MTKREFLKTAAGAPAVSLIAGRPAEAAREKFTPVDCAGHFTASARDFGPRRQLQGSSSRDGLLRFPAGRRPLRGIPFLLGEAGDDRKAWIALSRRTSGWSREVVEIPLRGSATYLCLAQFCDWDPNEQPNPDDPQPERVGQLLAEAVAVYEDGSEHRFPIRRRFEVNSPSFPWGHVSFASLTHVFSTPVKPTDPLPNAIGWGNHQMGLLDGDYSARPALWVAALENPHPGRPFKALRLEAKSEDVTSVCGVTLYHGRDNPLRLERLSLFRISLPSGQPADWDVSVDLGVVARVYSLPSFDPEAWLRSETAGFAERAGAAQEAPELYAEIAAGADATLVLRDKRGGAAFEFDLRPVFEGGEAEGRPRGGRIRVLERDKTWVHGRVIDKSTGRPTPVRLSMRSSAGRYIPPYGHRQEINAGWFQDYGADVRWGDSSFAYVDGTFQAELPAGEIYIEASKGFEYEPVRRKVRIEPGQRELVVEISRFADLRSRNWVTADSHVHFLSPSTAVLEGQAEGVNLVNVLAAQWGDLFTNVGDLAHGPLLSGDRETLVWVGTENRQHLMGHLALLGGRGEPVFPMSAAGPHETYIGGALTNSLSDWADACRKRDGLVVAVHFPYPTAELAADVVLGKIDAVELWPTGMSEQFETLRFQDWYRFLNCGYRLPAVAGTDKMGAWIPVGAYRGYAYLGQEEFSFPNWARAVRRGNTFMSSGPLLMLEADGRMPGQEISLRAGGGSIEVKAEARSAAPVHRLEIVLNGKVVASRQERAGARELSLKESVRVEGPSWIAARCASRHVSAGTRIAAHTSPVYLVRPGEQQFSGPAAAYMLTLMDGAEQWVRQLATRPAGGSVEHVLAVLKEARGRLSARAPK